ncbi:MAG TPA: hypothetical protein VF665_14915 [Longimicrobium sp.]|jgi:hypothetical protein|uniref:hypothetical protein n=1 Tax=Longimicrobium sp. TaxID=2029185 RepID=UPI002ED9298C
MKARRLTPVLALAVALSASGCAGFSVGCGGLAASDPMSDGASRLNPAYQRFQLRANASAMQQKAMIAGSQFRRDIRRPGQPMQMGSAGHVGGLCVR